MKEYISNIITKRGTPNISFKSSFHSTNEYCVCVCVCVCVCALTQSCLTLCDPMDYSTPGSSVHGSFQGRLLEWVAISFLVPNTGIKLMSPDLVGRCFTTGPPTNIFWVPPIGAIYSPVYFIQFYQKSYQRESSCL